MGKGVWVMAAFPSPLPPMGSHKNTCLFSFLLPLLFIELDHVTSFYKVLYHEDFWNVWYEGTVNNLSSQLLNPAGPSREIFSLLQPPPFPRSPRWLQPSNVTTTRSQGGRNFTALHADLERGNPAGQMNQTKGPKPEWTQFQCLPDMAIRAWSGLWLPLSSVAEHPLSFF